MQNEELAAQRQDQYYLHELPCPGLASVCMTKRSVTCKQATVGRRLKVFAETRLALRLGVQLRGLNFIHFTACGSSQSLCTILPGALPGAVARAQEDHGRRRSTFAGL